MKWRETAHGRLATEAGDLSDKGYHAEALALLERALECRRRDPMVLVYRGRVLSALGRTDEAEQSLRDALDVDSSFSHAWNELGMLNQSKGAFVKAAFCYEQSAKISPSAEILTVLANMQLAFDPQSAADNADLALSIDPEWAEARTVRDSAINEIRRLSEES